jgi:uncharacterized protein YdaU (DUF1376 family)
MTTYPYMMLYVADYLADTAHLNGMEHGAYLMLLMNQWQRGASLPGEDRKLSGITRLTLEQWLEVKDNVLEFFDKLEDGTISNARIERDLKAAQEKTEKAKENGRIGGMAKASNNQPSRQNQETLEPGSSQDQASLKRPLSDPKASLKPALREPIPQAKQTLRHPYPYPYSDKEEEEKKKTPSEEAHASSELVIVHPVKKPAKGSGQDSGDPELYQSINQSFLSRNGGKFTDYGKEGAAIKGIIAKARARDPENPGQLIQAMIEKFWQLKQAGEKLYAGQPFTPSALNASGIWDRVLEQYRVNSDKEAQDQEILKLLYGGTQ